MILKIIIAVIYLVLAFVMCIFTIHFADKNKWQTIPFLFAMMYCCIGFTYTLLN